MALKSAQGKGPAPREGVSWKRRLQRVSLRTKIVVPMVALAVIPGVAIAIFMISSMRETLRQEAAQRVIFETTSRAKRIHEFLQAVREDLLFLSQLKVIRELAAEQTTGRSERLAVLRREAEREFLIFSQGKRAYYQVRYLNGSGHEVVRLDAEQGLPRIVPVQQLQDKSHRYYVKEALSLESELIYVSRIDLNMEHGQVAVPHQAVLRFATPVLGEEGKPGGLLVINLFAHHLFSLVGPFPLGTEAWWVDENGYYLEYVGASEGKRRRYSLESQRRVSEEYTLEQVSAILRRQQQGQVMETAEALVAFAAISFDSATPDRRLTLIISHPRGPIEAPIRQLTMFLSIVVGVVVTVAAILGLLVAHYLARPVAILRQATGEIAGGNLSKHVDITTGDEIERLAVDFNAMTDRLREAQEQLATWNVELKQEVARRTSQLHHLQSGLARTDKLTSIGQMAAGVMHEIGNPLAAMKAKIQVAAEDGNLCGECGKVLSDLLQEVDRLAMFLRSFSRLGRLRELRLEDVSLVEVVQDVVTLVAPELRRRGVTLRVTAKRDVPTIRGDADQLRQLLINLILNAMEASRSGGVVLVRVQRMDLSHEVAGPSSAVHIEVVDHGVGMPREIIDKIWDPFFTTKREGTGLGLAICRQIVQDHNGKVHVQSEPGEGTVVSMTFPGWIPGNVKMAPSGLPSGPNRRLKQGQ